ncbi:cupin domain-containing protein [Halobacillus hunanensis]|uniref:cupin domain-containing protein n=1 Tax=Halobacillus hunanensis TaxID=578214 RepID=UPI0009A68D8A|nr:cupin domain-containing protein [Halobacillus hunanensis]
MEECCVNNFSYMYPYPNAYADVPMCNCRSMMGPDDWYMANRPGYENQCWRYPNTQVYTGAKFTDYGKEPFVVNINQVTQQNNTFRTTIWTGNHLQVTLMSINVGEDIGLEVHPDVDQFLRIEKGQGFVQMGNSEDNLNFIRHVGEDAAIMVPAGTWHNLTNTGNTPLKLYTIYAPPEHPFGTVHQTKADAIAAEDSYG